jgi:hypothetical protein
MGRPLSSMTTGCVARIAGLRCGVAAGSPAPAPARKPRRSTDLERDDTQSRFMTIVALMAK